VGEKDGEDVGLFEVGASVGGKGVGESEGAAEGASVGDLSVGVRVGL
jgi:hypothetical protein